MVIKISGPGVRLKWLKLLVALAYLVRKRSPGGRRTDTARSNRSFFSLLYLTMLLTKATGSAAAGRRAAALLRRCCVSKDIKPPSVHSRHFAASAGAAAPRHKTYPKHDFEHRSEAGEGADSMTRSRPSTTDEDPNLEDKRLRKRRNGTRKKPRRLPKS